MSNCAGARGVLEPEDGLRVEEVVLAVAAPLVLAAPLKFVQAAVALREGALVVRTASRRRSPSTPMPPMRDAVFVK